MPFRNAYYVISNMQFPLLSRLCHRYLKDLKVTVHIMGPFQIQEATHKPIFYFVRINFNNIYENDLYDTVSLSRKYLNVEGFTFTTEDFASFYHVLPQFSHVSPICSINDGQWSYHWQYFIDQNWSKNLTGAKPWSNRWFGFGLNFLPKSRSSFFSKNDSCFSSVHNKCSQKIVLIRSWFSEK